MFDYFRNPTLISKLATDKKYYYTSYEDLTDLFTKYSLRTLHELNCERGETKYSGGGSCREKLIKKRIDKLFKMVYKNQLNLLINPEVPVTLIYASHLNTINQLIIKGKKPISDTDYDVVVEPIANETVVYGPGDGTVSVDSALTPLLKWSHEFAVKEDSNDEKSKNYHPMEIVEYCSEANSVFNVNLFLDKKNIYRGKNYTRPENNRYSGIHCNNESYADHASLPGDPFVIKYLSSIISSYKIPGNRKIPDYFFKTFKKVDLVNLTTSCPFLFAPSDFQEAEKMVEYGIHNAKPQPIPNMANFILETTDGIMKLGNTFGRLAIGGVTAGVYNTGNYFWTRMFGETPRTEKRRRRRR